MKLEIICTEAKLKDPNSEHYSEIYKCHFKKHCSQQYSFGDIVYCRKLLDV